MKQTVLALFLAMEILFNPYGETGTAQEQISTEAEIDALCKQYSIVGMSVAAFQKEEVVYTHSYGMADVARSVPAAANTCYRTASIAKPITTMTALTLYDEGAIDLDQDISVYIGLQVRNPSYPEDRITTRQLMTHTASVLDSSAYYTAVEHTPFSGLSQLMKHKIFSPYPPGAIYIYSNLSAGLVGCVAEGKTGKHLWTLAEERIFSPLGLEATYLSKEIPDQSRLASIYSNGVLTFDPHKDGTAAQYYDKIPPGEMYMLGHGDLYLTASDLAKLGMVLAGDGSVGAVHILNTQTVRELNTLQFHVDPKPEGIPEIFRGLGVQLFPELLPGRSFAGHQGNAYGMIGCLLYEPETETGFALLTNGCRTGQRDGIVYDVNREMAKILYERVL